ncbi:MAG: hypothetical protein ACLTDR_01775 [Adlercreutzia equolifaciens]
MRHVAERNRAGRSGTRRSLRRGGLAVDAHVRSSAGPRIVSVDEAAALGDVDCVLVLGCGVHPDGRPSDMLAGSHRVRRRRAVRERHVAGAATVAAITDVLDYDEVNVMRECGGAGGFRWTTCSCTMRASPLHGAYKTGA